MCVDIHIGKGRSPRLLIEALVLAWGPQTGHVKAIERNRENEGLGGGGQEKGESKGQMDGFYESLSLQPRSNHRQYVHNYLHTVMFQLNLTYEKRAQLIHRL